MKQRLIGIDVARALAVVGMVIVNFQMVLGGKGFEWAEYIAGLFEGKAAATFVVLAGVGLALTTNTAVRQNDRGKLRTAKKRIIKRALFLFMIGLLYIPLWPADILHFYGVYMLITLLLLRSKPAIALIAALALIMIYPLIMLVWDYEQGWNFTTFEYADFWTLPGFFRNLFFNGFHPAIPWAAFMLYGFWFGKQDLQNRRFLIRAFYISTIGFFLLSLLSHTLILGLSAGNPQAENELSLILGTSPMPPLPIYMLSGIAIATVVISVCLLIENHHKNDVVYSALHKTGQLALTFYVAHVIIGMGIIEVFNPGALGTYTAQYSLAYALVFSLCCILFAVLWLQYKKTGPLEWLMKKLLD